MPYAVSNGVRTWYEVEGEGIPLVLHIGGFGSLDDWRRDDVRYTEALRDRYRLILLDPRGQGKSDAPHDPAAYTLAERANDVLAVLDDLGIPKAHFWGYSLGGSLGFELAARSADRLQSVIIGGANPYWEVDPDEPGGLLDWLRGGMEHFMVSYEAAFGPVPADTRARWLALDHEAMVAALLAPDRAAELVDALPEMRTPALLYAGTNDDPESAERAVRLMPNATFVPLEGLDHAHAFRCADLVLPHVLRFLARIEDVANRGATT
jgi:pimeloyl-ACP methyl ester carboxylesterase